MARACSKLRADRKILHIDGDGLMMDIVIGKDGLTLDVLTWVRVVWWSYDRLLMVLTLLVLPNICEITLLFILTVHSCLPFMLFSLISSSTPLIIASLISHSVFKALLVKFRSFRIEIKYGFVFVFWSVKINNHCTKISDQTLLFLFQQHFSHYQRAINLTFGY